MKFSLKLYFLFIVYNSLNCNFLYSTNIIKTNKDQVIYTLNTLNEACLANGYGNTLLHLFAELEQENLHEQISNMTQSFMTKNNLGYNPFTYAVMLNNTDVAILYLNTIINHLNTSKEDIINSQDNFGKTSLHWALLHNNQILINLLLDNEASILLKDENGLTSLAIINKLKNTQN